MPVADQKILKGTLPERTGVQCTDARLVRVLCMLPPLRPVPPCAGTIFAVSILQASLNSLHSGIRNSAGPAERTVMPRSLVRNESSGRAYAAGGRYRIDFAFFKASIVSSTLRRTVVSIELSAPPAPIASATAAIDTLSGASHRFQPSCSPKAYQNPWSFPPTDSM